MHTIVNFLVNNYIWFLVISLILLFTLIGYLVDITRPKIKENIIKNEKKYKDDKKENISLDKEENT